MKDVSHRDSLTKDAKTYLDVVFSDLPGPHNLDYRGNRWFVTFTDALTKESEVYFMKYKSETPAMYTHYKRKHERPAEGIKIRRFHSDGGGEFLGHNFQNDLFEDGTIFTYSVPASQQQNGVAERLNQTLINRGRKMLSLTALAPKYWSLSVLHANSLRNILPVAGSHLTPYEAVTGREPLYDHLRVFGCMVWSRHGSQEKYKKWDDRGTPGTFVGFEGTHVVRILTKEGKIIRATSCHFQERRTLPPGGVKPDCTDHECTNPLNLEDETTPFRTAWFDDTTPIPPTQRPDASDFFNGQPAEKRVRIEDTEPAPARRSNRVATHTQDTIDKADIRSFTTTAHLAYSSIEATFALLTAHAVTEPYEPASYKQAMLHQHKTDWFKATQEEFQSLLDNQTWNLVDIPLGAKIRGARWVFKYKRGLNGEVIRYKARWVVKGYEQQFGVDYAETFASVVKPMSYKALFAIAASLDLEIEQMDVKTAFLYGLLNEDVYVHQAEGFEDGSNRVYKLNKALYGLKQAPRVWYHTLSTFLCAQGFHAIDADSSVFSNGLLFVAVYVDDLLIVGPKMKEINNLKTALTTKFSMTNLGPVAYYLGMSVTRDRGNRILRLNQRSYLEEAIRAANMWDKPAQLTPMSTERLEPAPDGYISNFTTEYQTYVGTLMYSMLGTRPDIAYSVACVSRYASNPTPAHMQAVKRIFSYLKGSLDLELTYRGDLADLVGYSDSDWGGDPSTFRSTSGFVFNIGSGAISWSSKRQPTVALSTVEAEYGAQTQASKEAIWLRQLLRNLIPQESTPYATIIYCDNQGAIALAKDPKYHPRTKHIGIQHHWIRERIQEEEIELEYISTNRQVADGLTKPLPKHAFYLFRSALGLEGNML